MFSNTNSKTAVRGSTRVRTSPWKACDICPSYSFNSQSEFSKHLRLHHCSKEGGSYVCKYGPNKVCPSLPLDGVSDRDYEDHVFKDHMNCRRGMWCAVVWYYARIDEK